MDDDPSDRPAPDDDTTDQRLGRHAIGLLEAARADGDPLLVAQAEALAFTVGQLLAGRIRAGGRWRDD